MIEKKEKYLSQLKPFARMVYNELVEIEKDKMDHEKIHLKVLKLHLNPIVDTVKRIGFTPREAAKIMTRERHNSFLGVGHSWKKATPKQIQFWEELHGLKGKELYKWMIEEDTDNFRILMRKLDTGVPYTYETHDNSSSYRVFNFQVNAPRYLDTSPETLKKYLETPDGYQASLMLGGLEMPKKRLDVWKEHLGVKTKKELFYKILGKKSLNLATRFKESAEIPEIIEYTKKDLLQFLKNKDSLDIMTNYTLQKLLKDEPAAVKKMVKGIPARKISEMMTEKVRWAFRDYRKNKRDLTPLINLFHPYIIRRQQDAEIIYDVFESSEGEFDEVVNKFLSVARGKKQLKRTVNILSLVKTYHNLTEKIPNIDFTKKADAVEKNLRKAVASVPDILGLTKEEMDKFQKRDDIDLWLQTVPPLTKGYGSYKSERELLRELVRSVHNDNFKEWKFGEGMPDKWVKTHKRTFTESDALKNSPEVLIQYVDNSEKEFEEGTGPGAEFEALRTLIRRGDTKGTYEFLMGFLPNVKQANESAAEHLENISRRLREEIVGTKHTGLSRKVVVTDKIDPLVYLRIGHDPVRTCMNFAGGGFNQALISFSSDATKKIIGVYDKGRILSRGILHYADAKIKGKEKKVLLLDDIYTTHGQHNRFILDFALEKARKMKLPLVYRAPEGKELEFMVSGRAPQTYLDSAGGLKKQGEWRTCANLVVERPRRRRKK